MTPVGLTPVRAVLDNGATLVAMHTRKTPAVTISLAMRAGSMCDPVRSPGAVYLLSRVIDRGTTSRTASEIADAIESRGSTLSVTVNRHVCCLTCTCLAEDFESLLPILGDMLISPSVPDAELHLRKREVITSLHQDEDNPFVRAFEALLRLLYGADHPYGRPLKGTVESVDGLARDALLGLHADWFGPGALTGVFVGDVEPARALAVATDVFGVWGRTPSPAPAPAFGPATTAPSRQQVVIPMPSKAQADVAYGFVTIPRSDRSYYAASLMNNILGQYAMGGRLGDSIREKQGLAYYCSSAFDAGLIAGPLVVRAGVAAEHVDAVIGSIDDELRKLREHGVTAAELDDARQYLIGSMPRALEANAGIANFLQLSELFGLGLDHDRRLPELLRRVTRADVHEAAGRLLDPARATIVVAGPVGSL